MSRKFRCVLRIQEDDSQDTSITLNTKVLHKSYHTNRIRASITFVSHISLSKETANKNMPQKETNNA